MLENAAESPASSTPMMSVVLILYGRTWLRSENSIITDDRRNFIPKKQCRNYNVVSMNGDSPYKAMEIDLGDQGLPLRTLGCGNTI